MHQLPLHHHPLKWQLHYYLSVLIPIVHCEVGIRLYFIYIFVNKQNPKGYNVDITC